MEIFHSKTLNNSPAFKTVKEAELALADWCDDELLTSADQEVIYTKSDGRIVGCIVFSISSDGASCWGYISYVVPDKRRGGIFAAMYGELRRYCKEKGVIKIEWGTDAQNVAAQAVYDKMAEKMSIVYRDRI
jgi:RimJ/RimL family protein N-acetyltransferase